MDALPLYSELTGVGVFTARALSALAQRDDVEMLGYAVTWRRQSRLPGLLPPGVEACHVPMPARPLHAMWRRMDAPAIEWFVGSVDVVHGTNFVVPPTRRAAEVVSINDLTFLRFPQLCEPETLHLYPTLIRRAVRRGAMVHALSHAMASEITELLGVPSHRVRVVYLGVDPRPAGHEARAVRPYILSVGRAEPRKDLPRLVEAFDAIAADHPDLELVLAGPPGWGEDALNTAIDSTRHQSRIRRTGWVSDDQRAALLCQAAVFAYPSVYEGFGLPPLEAMAAGVPVVATAASAVAEVVGDAARLVPVGDTTALAGALDDVVRGSAERARLIDAGRRRAAEFTWERCAAGLRDLYVDAVARHRT